MSFNLRWNHEINLGPFSYPYKLHETSVKLKVFSTKTMVISWRFSKLSLLLQFLFFLCNQLLGWATKCYFNMKISQRLLNWDKIQLMVKTWSGRKGVQTQFHMKSKCVESKGSIPITFKLNSYCESWKFLVVQMFWKKLGASNLFQIKWILDQFLFVK